uniref:Putative methyltransferase n=1 Tax=viral metagenome TaxID=1070528 RepID=A0A6M3LYE2_9ZZZZ
MRQKKDVEEYFKQFFAYWVPDNIIEFGTGDGEFTAILRKLGMFDIYSFDIQGGNIEIPGVTYYKMDIFKYEKDIVDIFKLNKILLLCDDGDKIKEIGTFAKYLKSGDVIMAHDYADDMESFNKFKYWRTCELIFADVQDALKEFKLFHHDLMVQAGWMSYMKL